MICLRSSSHRLVLVEGNYLLHDIAPWSQLAHLFDERWYIDCSVDEAMARVYDRACSIGVPPDVAQDRTDGNDRLNAIEIETMKQYADIVVPSYTIEE